MGGCPTGCADIAPKGRKINLTPFLADAFLGLTRFRPAVLGDWGCGKAKSGNPPQNIMDCIRRYASDPQRLQTCIEAMTLTGSN